MESKVAFHIAYVGYKNEQENIHVIHKRPIKQDVAETREVVETYPLPPPPPTPAPETEKEMQTAKKEKGKARE